MSLFPDTPSFAQEEAEKQRLQASRPISLHEVRRTAKRKLLDLVVPAIEALERATISGDKDDYISVKAACAILDRTGFGTHSTITIDDKTDYTKMSNDELHSRLDAAKKLLPSPTMQASLDLSATELNKQDLNEGNENTQNNVSQFPKSIH